jgi:hypothetical protein
LVSRSEHIRTVMNAGRAKMAERSANKALSKALTRYGNTAANLHEVGGKLDPVNDIVSGLDALSATLKALKGPK